MDSQLLISIKKQGTCMSLTYIYCLYRVASWSCTFIYGRRKFDSSNSVTLLRLGVQLVVYRTTNPQHI